MLYRVFPEEIPEFPSGEGPRRPAPSLRGVNFPHSATPVSGVAGRLLLGRLSFVKCSETRDGTILNMRDRTDDRMDGEAKEYIA